MERRLKIRNEEETLQLIPEKYKDHESIMNNYMVKKKKKKKRKARYKKWINSRETNHLPRL